MTFAGDGKVAKHDRTNLYRNGDIMLPNCMPLTYRPERTPCIKARAVHSPNHIQFPFTTNRTTKPKLKTMAKFLIVLCAFIACAAAKPGLIGAPLAYTAPVAYGAPLAAAYTSPLAYTAAAAYAVPAQLAYANAHLDAAYASQRVDIKQNYNAAIVPTTFAAAAVPAVAAAAPVAPLKYTAAAPIVF